MLGGSFRLIKTYIIRIEIDKSHAVIIILKRSSAILTRQVTVDRQLNLTISTNNFSKSC
jgi:hypothetical protein